MHSSENVHNTSELYEKGEKKRNGDYINCNLDAAPTHNSQCLDPQISKSLKTEILKFAVPIL